MHVLLAASLLAAAPAPAPWTAQVAGVTLSISAADVRITKGDTLVYSAAQPFRAKMEKDAVEWAANLATGTIPPENTVAQVSLTYTPESLVGPYLAMKVDQGWDWPGAAHPSGMTDFDVIDVRSPDGHVSLDQLFPAEAIRNALLDDSLVADHVPDPEPDTLPELLKVLEAVDECEYTFRGMLKSFAFLEVAKGKVAVRIGLSHGCEAARNSFTQLGIWLDIPPALRADFEAARTGTAGFLMKGRRPGGPVPTVLLFEKDLKPLIAKARAGAKKK